MSPVERAVLQQVRDKRTGWTAAELRHRVAGDTVLGDLARDLRARRWLRPPYQRLRVVAGRRLLLAVAVLGLAAAVASVVPDLLPGPLAIAGAAVLVALSCHLWSRRRAANPVTPAGRAVLSGVPAVPDWTDAEEMAPVALHGLSSLSDTRLAGALRKDTRARRGSRPTCCAPGACSSYRHAEPASIPGEWSDHSPFAASASSGGSGGSRFSGDSGESGGDCGGGGD
jgi:hypothetical protein